MNRRPWGLRCNCRETVEDVLLLVLYLCRLPWGRANSERANIYLCTLNYIVSLYQPTYISWSTGLKSWKFISFLSGWLGWSILSRLCLGDMFSILLVKSWGVSLVMGWDFSKKNSIYSGIQHYQIKWYHSCLIVAIINELIMIHLYAHD